MKRFLIFSALLGALILGSCAGQFKAKQPAVTTRTPEPTLNLNTTLPVDSQIIRGKLDNGITYYIRKNKKPEDRLELRLVVNAGSILEDDDQQGLAHLCEHMAFNGSKHFHKQALVSFLESIGMRFGADLNAYTGFDETVYMLQVPTDSAAIIDKAFTVLEDWAHYVSYDDTEIDKEKGVVIEEWRLGRGARQRMMDKQLPILLKGSRYALRLPIGQKAVLDTFKHQTLKKFYHTWYRPDLMAVVAVGDLDPQIIKQEIIKHFAYMKNNPNEKKRTLYPVPSHKQTLFAIASDPEATQSSVSMYYLLPVEHEKYVKDYRQSIVESLFNMMLNQRFSELLHQKNPPFLYAYSSKGNLVRTKDFYILGAASRDNGIPRAFKTLLTEAKRVQQFGFTKTELERVKKSSLRRMEKYYLERNKTESRSLASEYIRNFLQQEPIPGIKFEYELYKKYIPTIRLEEVDALISQWMNDQNRVILVNAPQKEGVAIPTKEELQQIIESIKNTSVSAYKDKTSNEPLLAKVPSPGKIISEKTIADLGLTEWTLNNGIKVILKPTTFKNDQIIFTAFSPGGYSLVDNEHLIAAKTAGSIISGCGLGNFNQIQLQKMLAGKMVQVVPSINELTETVSGQASPKDLETLFQLIYLTFTAPRTDSSAFESYKSRMIAYYQNKGQDPSAVYQDSLTAIITQHNPRFAPFTTKTIKHVDLMESYKIYRERFGDAGDFTFIFVGNFNKEQLKPLVETYLCSLPALNRKEHWADNTYSYPKGVIDRAIKKGLEPKSYTTIIFTGKQKWNEHNRSVLDALADALQIKLRERLREDKSGTYSIGVYARLRHYPRERYSFGISFGSAPERVEELTKEVFIQIDSLKKFGFAPSYLEKVKEMGLREYETNLKQNNYWVNKLRYEFFNQQNPEDILQVDDRYRELTLDELQQAAKFYLKDNNYVRIVLLPEKTTGK